MSVGASHQFLFEGFAVSQVDVGETTIQVRHGGSGPPLLLLHGIPETHLMWHKVAPRLAADFTVVAADLRGYGDSSKPPSAPDHAPYSKRAMARDMVVVMRQLGFDGFFLAGHDRGARVAYRLALDHPERVRKLAVLDIVPTGDAMRRVDSKFALGFWVWFFLAQPYDLPERVVGAAPRVFLDHMLDSWGSVPGSFPAEVREVYLRNFRDPETLHAICEEYRAAMTLDVQHDEADRGRRRITCPVLVLWSAEGWLHSWDDPLAVWRGWADDVRGRALACGHFLPEEAPEETYAELRAFFGADPAVRHLII
jgi:haloacetate dehalogenase